MQHNTVRKQGKKMLPKSCEFGEDNSCRNVDGYPNSVGNYNCLAVHIYNNSVIA